MELVKQNKEKGRSVFKDGNKYIKAWDNVKPQWIVEHVKLLRNIVPDMLMSTVETGLDSTK